MTDHDDGFVFPDDPSDKPDDDEPLEDGDALHADEHDAPVEPPDAAPVHLAGCTGKVKHATKGAALAAASRHLRVDTSTRPAPLALRSYLCPHCGKWHLTSRVRF